MYYRLSENGNILDFARGKYHDDCLYTEDENIIKSPDGLYYLKGTEPEQVKVALLEKRMTTVTQTHLDNVACQFGYDNCAIACSYIDTGVAKYDAEGRAFRRWRALVWEKCFELLEQTKQGLIEELSDAELLQQYPLIGSCYSE